MSVFAAQTWFAQADPAAPKIAMLFTNALRSIPSCLWNYDSTTAKLDLPRRNYFRFISIDQMAPGLIYMLARNIPRAS